MIRFVIVLCLASLACGAVAGEVDIARAALRDGLWDTARLHAGKVLTNDVARLVMLESYACEGKWKELAERLDGWKDSRGPAFDYYRAVVRGDDMVAAALLRSGGTASGVADSRMLEAAVLLKNGNRKGAEALWRSAVAATNADERTQTIAAVNLVDVAALRRLYSSVRSKNLRLLAGLSLGRALLSKPDTRKEGETLVRSIVKDSPDVEGARGAFLAIAESAVAEERWSDACAAYRDAVEIWPELAKSADVQQGRGISLLRLGKPTEALESFRRAEALATDDESRSLAALRQADAMSALGQADEALAAYRSAKDRYPNTDVAKLLSRLIFLREREADGRRLYREYRFKDARKAFADVAAADPSRKPGMDYLDALCLFGMGQDDEAEKVIAALAKSPDVVVSSRAVLWLAKRAYNRGQWKRARELFDGFATGRPDDPQAADAMLWGVRSALADRDFAGAVITATRLAKAFPNAPQKTAALALQGEALIEEARFDEAVLVLEEVVISSAASEADRVRARRLMADALFAMGADNPARYQAALDTYREIAYGAEGDATARLTAAFKIARTLEKLKRVDEALDQYYAGVVLAYRDGRAAGVWFGDEGRAAFTRAVLRLADDYEKIGRPRQAMSILSLATDSDVPAAAIEARKRIDRIMHEGRF